MYIVKILAETIFSDSVIFIEKKSVENRLWAKSHFWGAKKVYSWHIAWHIAC